MSFVHFTDIINRAIGLHSDLANLEEACGMYGWRYGQSRQEVRDEIQSLWRLMESPIEATLFPYLVMQDYGQGFAPARARPSDEPPAPGHVVVVPQLVFGPFRLDFAIMATRLIDGDPVTATIAVECDGQEFHEAIRDTKRDLYMYERGVVTVRASGHEIFSEPADVARRAARLVAGWGA